MQTQAHTITDDTLLLAWRAGDRKAGAALVRRHSLSISRFFTRKLGRECEDLVQDTFVAAVEGVERYRGESSFRAYLFGIARYKLLRHLRTRTRRNQIFDPSTTSAAQVVPSHSSVFAAQQRHELLVQAMRELPLDVQTMLELHYWERMRVREIADVVELPINTVKCRMRRGRQKLAAALGEA